MPDIASHRLSRAQYESNFADAQPPLTPAQALVEADRCHYCFDAPCTRACPTSIDVPSFIRRIAQDDALGAAQTILQSNVLGGMCARVCPTETLCEEACVRHDHDDAPVKIGRLQRFATDAYFARLPDGVDQGPNALFRRASDTGRRVAVVGAGPAGLACAHHLSRLGHSVTLMDARPKLGGLNEYGLATYKTVDDFAQKEIRWLLGIGGITTKLGIALGRDVQLSDLQRDYDAVFLGVGLAGVQALGVPEPASHPGIRAAVDFIAALRQAQDKAAVPVGRRVVVIGGGMTAVDAAVQSRLLGAEEVTIVYRRGQEHMPASGDEQEWAQTHGVSLRLWASPVRVDTVGDALAITFARTEMQGGKLRTTDDTFTMQADMLLKAVGQTLVTEPLKGLKAEGGKLVTDADGKTMLDKVWAGGDCRANGKDLTVAAVEDGKRAAHAIHQALSKAQARTQGANHG